MFLGFKNFWELKKFSMVKNFICELENIWGSKSFPRLNTSSVLLSQIYESKNIYYFSATIYWSQRGLKSLQRLPRACFGSKTKMSRNDENTFSREFSKYFSDALCFEFSRPLSCRWYGIIRSCFKVALFKLIPNFNLSKKSNCRVKKNSDFRSEFHRWRF